VTLRLLLIAQAELDDAVAWYNTQVPGLGDAFLTDARRVFHLIEQRPDAWHPLAPGVRRCRFTRYPYGVIYTPGKEGQLIVAIAHLHRAPTYWRDRLSGMASHTGDKADQFQGE